MSYSGQGEIFYCDHYTNAKIAGYDLLARDSGNASPVRNASSNVVYGLEIMSTV